MTFSQDGQPSAAVDPLVFTIEENKQKERTIRRQYPPFEGFRGLEGIYLHPAGEDRP